jgi:hypothetical protein
MRKWHYAVGALVILLAAVLTVYIRNAGPPVNRDQATWIWDLNGLLEGSEANIPEVKDFLLRHRVRTVYLHAGEDVEGSEKPLFRSFIRQVGSAGVQVQALGGERNWALPEGRSGMYAFLDRIDSYNASVPQEERFAGIHLDVEPYSLPEWDKDQSEVVRQWKKTMNAAAEYARIHSLQLGIDLPFWLDRIPASADDSGSSGKLDRWMMAMSDSVTLMSYRDKAEGADGVLALVKQELEDAQGSGAKVLVGLNVAPDSEAKLTFDGEDAGRFRAVASRIRRAYAGNAGFGGIAVHDLAAWMRLEK